MSKLPNKFILTKTYLPPKLNSESIKEQYQKDHHHYPVSNPTLCPPDNFSIPPFINRSQCASGEYSYQNGSIPTHFIPPQNCRSYIPPDPAQNLSIIPIKNSESHSIMMNPISNSFAPLIDETPSFQQSIIQSKLSLQNESDSFEYESSDSDNKKKKDQTDWGDEDDKNDLKERNRVAAKKWRQKKDQYLNQLEMENDLLRQQALSLLKQVRSLNSENQLLEEELLFFQAYMTQIMHVTK